MAHLQPLTLRPDLGLVVGGVLVCGIAFTGGVAMIADHHLVSGILVTSVMVFVFLGSSMVFFRQGPYLAITDAGLSYEFRPDKQLLFIPWASVTGLRTGWLPTEPNFKMNKRVFIDYNNNKGRARIYFIFPRLYATTADDLMSSLSTFYDNSRHQSAG